MRWLQLLIVLVGVSLMAAPMAEQTAKLRGPKEFDTPAVSRLGPLSAHDTLWRLAAQVRPDPRVNIYQVMFALYQKNPDSFLDSNFNHLKPGTYLDVPNLREIMAIDAMEAQRKSENDDREWSEKIRLAAQIKPEDHSAKQKDLEAARAEISEELSQLQSEQSEQLGDLRDKLSASMANVESIVKENGELKTQLDTVVGQLGNVKQQLDKDSEIQQQLQQLLAQQQEMLSKQNEQIKKAEEESFGNVIQKLANSPMGWAIAAALPALVLLFMFVSIMRRKGQKAAAVVSAATAAPLTDPNYKSPLPPMDDSLDFDESSLINLDDSLLNSRKGGGIRLDDDFDMPSSKSVSNSFSADDLLDDQLDLPDEPMLPASTTKNADELVFDDLLDEPLDTPVAGKTEFDANNILSGDDLSALFSDAEDSFVPKQEFDPNNILSGNELSSLFENLADDDELSLDLAPAPSNAKAPAMPDDEDDVDIDALLAQNGPAENAIASAASESIAADELLEEIELELPGDDPTPLEISDDEFDIDALVNANQPAAKPQAEPTPPSTPASALTDDEDDDFTDIDAILAANAQSKPVAPVIVDETVDTSELDAFAESLVEEIVPDKIAASTEVMDELDVDVIEEPELAATDELDDILNEVAELRAQSAASAQQLAEQIPVEAWQLAKDDFDESPLSLDDVGQLLQESEEAPLAVLEEEVQSPASGQSSQDDEPLVDIGALSEQQAAEPHDDMDDLIDAMTADLESATLAEPIHDEELELAAHSEAEAEYLTEFAELEAHQEMPDLAVAEAPDDLPASRAQLSVENPSRVLETYPDLDLDDADLDSIFSDDLHEDIEPLDAFNLETETASTLEKLDETDFDALLADLSDEVVDDELRQDVESTTKALEELASMPELLDEDHADDGALLPDYVQIDKLLAAAEDLGSADDARPLNIDVGLADFEDLITADEQGDVDLQDNGFASRLDLVRAYIEIGDQESADQLIKELISSDAPDHVKAEAKSLHS